MNNTFQELAYGIKSMIDKGKEEEKPEKRWSFWKKKRKEKKIK